MPCNYNYKEPKAITCLGLLTCSLSHGVPGLRDQRSASRCGSAWDSGCAGPLHLTRADTCVGPLSSLALVARVSGKKQIQEQIVLWVSNITLILVTG